MVLTSNRDIREWSEVFADPVLANAAIDRMFEHAEIIAFEGKSYRLKDTITLPSLKPEDVAPERGGRWLAENASSESPVDSWDRRGSGYLGRDT